MGFLDATKNTLLASLLVCFGLAVPRCVAQSPPSRADSALFLEGQQAYDDGDYQEAIRLMRRALAQDSMRAEAHALIARAYDARGKRLMASRHASLAVRHGDDTIEYLELRHHIGFINPVPVARMRKRALIKKILSLDPNNVYAHTEQGREHALLYFNHKDRIRMVDNLAPANVLAQTPRQVTQGEGLIGDAQDLGTQDVPDPFNIEQVTARGYNMIRADERAIEALPGAVYHLRRALFEDPASASALELLMAVYAFAEEHPPMLQQATIGVQYNPDNPYAHLYLGYAAYKTGDLELAREQFDEGIARLSQEEQDVFHDVERVMNNDLKKKLDDAGFDQEAYWNNKDPLFLTEQNERELEHYARLVYSDLLFSEPKLDQRGWDSERGEIYVRYGHPLSMYFLTASFENCDTKGVGNQSNFQVFEYGAYKFIFSNPGSSIGASGSGASVIGIPTLNEFILYSPCAAMFAGRSPVASNMDYVIIARSHIKQMPDDYRMEGNVVQFPHLATVLRDAQNHPQVLVAYGFPVLSEDARSQNPGNTTRLGLEAGAFLVTQDGPVQQQIQSIDRVFTDEILLFDQAALWPGTHLLPAAPGAYTLSVEFTRAHDGAIGSRKEELDIPPANGELAMSDILLAYFVEYNEEGESADAPSGTFVRYNYEIQAAPWGVYENGKPVYLYFELYDLPRSPDGTASYTVEAAIVDAKDAEKGSRGLFRRARRNDGDGVSVRFESNAASSRASEYFIMETQDIPPGTYVLIVQVTDKATGVQAEKRRTLFLK